MSRKKWFFIVLFFWGLSNALAQEKLPAKEAFDVLSNRYAITFSFIENEVENISLEIPRKDLPLSEVLLFLQQHPLLSFKKVNENRIAVAVKNTSLTICGTIVDADTNEVLKGASALVLGVKGTITNQKGEFNLIGLKKEEILEISFLGYEKQQFRITEYISLSSNCPTIALVPKSFQLNEIVVRNLFTTGLNKKIDGSINFSTDSYGILPGLVDTDLLQMVQVLPGVQSVNESIADINVRGGSHDQNLILWDDIKMYHSGHFFGLISAFNPDITSQVKVTKNGTSAEFTDGVSGTIQMISDDEVNTAFKGSVGANLLSANAVMRIPVSDKIAVHVSGRRSFTDYFTTPTYEKYFDRSFQDSEVQKNQNQNINTASDFYFYDFSGKLLYDLNDNHKLRISLLGVQNQLTYSENTSEQQNPQARKSTLKQANFAVATAFSSKWSDVFSTEFKSYYTNYDLEAFDLNVNTDQSILQLNQVTETGIKLVTKTKISDQLLWDNGYSYTETGAQNASDLKNPTYQINKKRVQRNHGLFSEITYANNGLFVRAGARLNYFERLGSFLVEPRLNVSQKLGNSVSVKLQGEFKNQTISQFVDLNDDFLGVENRRWVVSDGTTIPVVKSKQISLGVDYKNKGWFVELSPYYKKVSGIITESQGFIAQNQYDGFKGSSSALGLEFLINKRVQSSNVWLSYTYGNQEYFFESISNQNFPSNFDITHALHLASSISITDSWSFSAGAQYRTGRPYTIPVQGNETYQDGNFRRVNYDELNAERLAAYTRVDISTAYDFKFDDAKKLSLSFGVLNLLNKKNSINRYYKVSTENENEAVQVDNLSLGFTPNFALKFTF